MFNKTIVATALLGLGLAASAQASDPTANVVFRGLVGNSIPGDNLIITGNNGAEQIADGALFVNQDGTFTTSDAVKVEARDYTPATDTTEAEIGEINTNATWRMTGITTLFGANTSAEAATTVTDQGPAAVTLGATASDATGELLLDVSNETPVTDVEGYSSVTVSVALTATIGA